jgi:hypothetical protein
MNHLKLHGSALDLTRSTCLFCHYFDGQLDWKGRPLKDWL